MLKRSVLTLAIIALTGCTRHAIDVQPVGGSYFPLAVGNRWIFQESGSTSQTRRDTLVIDARTKANGIVYYRVRASWPGLTSTGAWVRRDDQGNLIWSDNPNATSALYLRFDAEVGQRWPLPGEFSTCFESLQLLDDYAVVNTPAGRFDGAREIGGGWIDCTDVGWTADFARGVGPVRWESITIAGPTNWLLVDAIIQDETLMALTKSRPDVN